MYLFQTSFILRHLCVIDLFDRSLRYRSPIDLFDQSLRSIASIDLRSISLIDLFDRSPTDRSLRSISSIDLRSIASPPSRSISTKRPLFYHRYDTGFTKCSHRFFIYGGSRYISGGSVDPGLLYTVTSLFRVEYDITMTVMYDITMTVMS